MQSHGLATGQTSCGTTGNDGRGTCHGRSTDHTHTHTSKHLRLSMNIECSRQSIDSAFQYRHGMDDSLLSQRSLAASSCFVKSHVILRHRPTRYEPKLEDISGSYMCKKHMIFQLIKQYWILKTKEQSFVHILLCTLLLGLREFCPSVCMPDTCFVTERKNL